MTGLESSSKAGSDKSKEYSIYANYSHCSSFEVFRLLKAYIFNIFFLPENAILIESKETLMQMPPLTNHKAIG